jgi:hypothetical protein
MTSRHDRPTPDQIAALRAGSHRDVDAVYDVLADMADMAAVTYRPPQPPEEDEPPDSLGDMVRGIYRHRLARQAMTLHEYRQLDDHQAAALTASQWSHTSGSSSAGARSLRPETIRAHGGHSDPTGDAATATNPARQWLRRYRRVVHELHSLQAQALEMLGPAVCPECRKPVEAGQRSTRVGDVEHHQRCGVLAQLPAARNVMEARPAA